MDNQSLARNYQPISLLRIMSEVLEKVLSIEKSNHYFTLKYQNLYLDSLKLILAH